MSAEAIARQVWGERMRLSPFDALLPETRDLLVTVAERAMLPAPAPEVEPEAPMNNTAREGWPDFRFMSGPWENSELPTIVRRDPEGGDPHIICVLKRVHNPEAIYEMIDRANACRDADLAGYLKALELPAGRAGAQGEG